MPYAFTELGVAMLSSVLRSPLAISININIMRAFVEMRKYMALRSEESLQIENLRLELQSQRNYIEDILRDQNDINEETAAQLELINETLAEMQVSERNKAPRKKIGFV
jgi:small-conductance mechanosensitive channel